MLLLLAGIVAMHSAVFAPAHAEHSAHAPVVTFAPPDHSNPPFAALAPPDHSDPPAATPVDEHVTVPAIAHPARDTPALAGAPFTDSTLLIAAPDDPHTGCGAAGCDEHTAIHACVFVLAALAIALTLVLLYRLGDTVEAARRPTRAWRGRRERPPPWTVLTLSQLAILRI